jgi:hypothetical protein
MRRSHGKRSSNKFHQIFHPLAHLGQVAWLVSSWSSFWLSNICKASIPLLLCHKPLDDRRKWRTLLTWRC